MSHDTPHPLIILFNTWLAAFDCPGGGEVQLLKYEEQLTTLGARVVRDDPWNPRSQLDAADIVHHFAVQGGSWRLCAHVKEACGLPLVISPIVNGVDEIFFTPVDPALFRERCGIREPARLIIKAMNAEREPYYWKALHDENRCGEAVIFIDEVFSSERSAKLLNTCDAFVSLHRSEGFGRLLAEAMSLGKLLTASSFGGNTDFTTPKTACPVSGRLVDVKPGEYLFGEGQQWFEADIEHAAHYMRDFAMNPGSFAALAENGRRHILEHHSLERVGRIAKEALVKTGIWPDTAPHVA